MSPVVRISSLVKTFGSFTALDGLDLTVEPGEVHGFLGPNGAGKSTTIRVLLGLLRADSGAVELLGGDPVRDAASLHRRLAYVPGDVNLWPNLTGMEAINLLSGLRGSVDRARRDEFIERFGLDPGKKGRAYSKGNRQKVALVSAFASDVDLLILDEPTSGLDPLMEVVFQDCVADAVSRGTTVLLSSHILGEVEKLCDRVSIVRAGRNVETGTLSDLRHLTRTEVVATTVRPAQGLDGLAGVHDLHVEGSTVSLSVDTEHLGATIATLARAGISELVSRPPTLEQLFLSHYSADVRTTVPSRGRDMAGGER
jgi:ABC-2 type transport system ATP-binding protein